MFPYVTHLVFIGVTAVTKYIEWLNIKLASTIKKYIGVMIQT